MGYDSREHRSWRPANLPPIAYLLNAYVCRFVRYTTLYRRPSSRTVIRRQSEYARLAVGERARRAISPDIHTRSIQLTA